MLNSFDALFITRTVELLKIDISRRFHLFIVGKSLTTDSKCTLRFLQWIKITKKEFLCPKLKSPLLRRRLEYTEAIKQNSQKSYQKVSIRSVWTIGLFVSISVWQHMEPILKTTNYICMIEPMFYILLNNFRYLFARMHFSSTFTIQKLFLGLVMLVNKYVCMLRPNIYLT